MNSDKLPPFRKAVDISFFSLRIGIGSGLGIIPDCDTQVVRRCYRAKNRYDKNGWSWKIKGYNTSPQWDLVMSETDQEILDESGSELEFKIVGI